MGDSDEFRVFVQRVEPRLRRALTAACGVEAAADAVQEALVYGWKHWDRVRQMDNPAGYLFTVARSRVRRPRLRPARVVFPPVDPGWLPEVEPDLPEALGRLTERQRVAVLLVEGCGWTYQETAEVMGTSVSTVRNHRRRGLRRLRMLLGVSVHA